MVSILIVDDHPFVVQGCERILEDAGIELILEANDVAHGYDLYLHHRPDVVIVDLAFVGDDLVGLTLVRRIREHDSRTRLVVLTMHNDPAIMTRSLEAGASGHVLKDISPVELVKAVHGNWTAVPFIGADLALKIAPCQLDAPTKSMGNMMSAGFQCDASGCQVAHGR
jgi:two-component system, NarL family, invasion response regulator UvrY